ncbi:MAG: carboxypeptidase-like regulatory domain-containing protein [Planctomycetes bacterium]|nr:carboxypeptidase-like regulatory domain-containing protein [Planctomycetota bacterium]
MSPRLALALLVVAGCAAEPAVTWREAPLAEVEVRVLAGGVPVPGVEVVLGKADRWRVFTRPVVRRSTDAEGVARARLRARAVDVIVEPPGFVAHRSAAPVRDGVARAVVSLEPEAPLRGRVLDPAGRPVAGVTVRVVAHHRWFRFVGTDEAGRFEVRSLAPGWYELTAGAGPDPHHVPVTADVLAPATDVLLTLGTGGAVDVEVVPPPGARFARSPLGVELHRLDPGSGEWRHEHGAGGWPRFVHLPPGTYRAALRVTGLGAGVTAPFEVAAAADVAVRLPLTPGRVVTGRVVDARGAPVEARLLLPWTAADEATPTQDAGGFYLAHAPEAAFDLVVAGHDGGRLAVVRVPAGAGRTALEVRVPGAAPRRPGAGDR